MRHERDVGDVRHDDASVTVVVPSQRSTSLPAVAERRRRNADHSRRSAAGDDVCRRRLDGSMIDLSGRNATTTTAPTTPQAGDELDAQRCLDVDGDSEADNSYCLPASPMLKPLQRRLLEPQRERFLTAYERLSYELASDKRCMREIALGKRVGFYHLRNQIGSGNFSTVKLGVHILTRGQYCRNCCPRLDQNGYVGKRFTTATEQLTSVAGNSTHPSLPPSIKSKGWHPPPQPRFLACMRRGPTGRIALVRSGPWRLD